MPSFFENLSYIMGGEENITPQFRSAFGDYNNTTVEQPSSGGGAPATSQQAVPVGVPNFGYGQAGYGQDAGYGIGSYFTPSPNNLTVEEPTANGMYAGNITYNPQQSAYSNINPYSWRSDPKSGASDLAARVERAKYQDYLNRFAPIENFAVNQINGRETKDLGYDLRRANQSVINAGQNLQGQQERAMGRFGLQYAGPSIAESNQIVGGQVAAMNQARMADENRALGMIGGGSSGTGG